MTYSIRTKDDNAVWGVAYTKRGAKILLEQLKKSLKRDLIVVIIK